MSDDKADELSAEVSQEAMENGEQSLDQIREILFGSQARDIDSRFDDLNQHLSASLEGLRALIREHFDALTQQLENEVRTLRAELHAGQKESRDKHAGLEKQQHESADSLRQQISTLKETLTAAEQSLRGASEQGLGELQQQLASEMEAVRNEFQRTVDQVAHASVTRKSFGEALRELSTRFDNH